MSLTIYSLYLTFFLPVGYWTVYRTRKLHVKNHQRMILLWFAVSVGMQCHVPHFCCSSDAQFHITCFLLMVCRSAVFVFPYSHACYSDLLIMWQNQNLLCCLFSLSLATNNKSGIIYWSLLLNRIRKEEFMAG